MGVHARNGRPAFASGANGRTEIRTRVLGRSDVLAVAREFVDAGLEVTITARGESMQPAIASGDRVLLSPRQRALRVGDVVLADVDGWPVLHRVVSSRGACIVMRGDARPRCDPPIAESAVIAIALEAEGAKRPVALAFTARFGLRALARGALLCARALAKHALASRDGA